MRNITKIALLSVVMGIVVLLPSTSQAELKITGMKVYDGGRFLGFYLHDDAGGHGFTMAVDGDGDIKRIVLALPGGIGVTLSESGAMTLSSRPASWSVTRFNGNIAKVVGKRKYYAFVYYQNKLSKLTYFDNGRRKFTYEFQYFQGKISKIYRRSPSLNYRMEISYFQGKISKIFYINPKGNSRFEFSYFQGQLSKIYHFNPHYRYELQYYQGRFSAIRYYSSKGNGSYKMIYKRFRIQKAVKSRHFPAPLYLVSDRNAL